VEFYVRVTILPIWPTVATGTREARERGELRMKFLELAEEFEAKIKKILEERNG